MQPLATTALLVSMAITAIHARTCGAPEWNTDYYGDDVGHFATTGDFGNMLKQCCDGCTGNSSCVAYTLANNVCYLKSGGGNRKPMQGATSALMSRTPAPVGTCSAPESNVDYYGNDLSKQLVSGSQADQTKACCDACAKTDGCNAFSIADGICYLKSSDAGRKAAPGVISAKKAGATSTPTSTPMPIVGRKCGSPEWNTDFAGNDLSNFGTTGNFDTMLGQCCDACKADAKCGAYTLAENVCYLKTAAGDRKPTKGATSVTVFEVTAPPTPATTAPPTPTTAAPTVPVVGRKCGSPEWNTDYAGNDISNFGTTGDFDTMLGQCCDACRVNAKCGAYTLAENVCYLKTAAGDRKPTKGATSVTLFAVTGPPTSTPTSTPMPIVGRKCGSPEWNTDFAGNDLSNFGTTGNFDSMLSQCCDACKADAKCGAYTLAENVCYLKTAAGDRKPTNGATSVAVFEVTAPPTPTTKAS